jgi:uncharacterized phiE125 gp8 family phage protein
MKFCTLVRSSDPAAEPVSLTDAKEQLRITHSDDDDYITALIVAAREWAEEFTKTSFITQTWTAEYPSWPVDRILDLPRPPLQSVTTLKYRDADDAQQTISDTQYQVETGGKLIKLLSTFGSPGLQADREFPIEAIFVTGAGDASTDVSSKIILAIKIMITHYYVNRVPVAAVFTSKIPLSAEALLGSIKYRNI